MAACVASNMECIPEEPGNYPRDGTKDIGGVPHVKRKRSLTVSMPQTTLSEEEKHLGIYEDIADCDDLSDSENEYWDENEDEYDDFVSHLPVGNHGNNLKDASKIQKLDVNSLVIPPLNLRMAMDDDNHLETKDSDSLDVNISGLRGKANTPNSMYSEISELVELQSGKNSRLGMESREAVYKKAMDLMTVRCTSVQGNNGMEERNVETPLICVKNQPFGMAFPKYFYVQQNRPLPMPPLKAWRGYNGNVYFEPMQVNQVKCSAPEAQTPDIDKCSEKLKKIMEPRFKTPDPSQSQPTRPSAKSEKPSTSRQSSDSPVDNSSLMSVSISDKKAILNRLNQKLREEDYWPEVGRETVGSLKVETNGGVGKNKVKTSTSNKPTYQKDKICKGSVAHKVAAQRKSKPMFSVNGGKFVAPTSMSPLLRTQTQYSQSNQRQGMNSPDLFNSGAYEKLPPLEQLRASLRHMDNTTDKSMVVVPPSLSRRGSQKGKPAYVKYSHDQYGHGNTNVKQVSRS